MKIEFNRTTENLVMLATSKADRKKLQDISDDMARSRMAFTIEADKASIALHIPVTSGSFMQAIARFTATHSAYLTDDRH